LGLSEAEAAAMVCKETEILRDIGCTPQPSVDDEGAPAIANRVREAIIVLLKYADTNKPNEGQWPGALLLSAAREVLDHLDVPSSPEPLTNLQLLVSWLACKQVTRSGKHVESKDMARMCILGGYWPQKHSEYTVNGLLRRIENDVNHHRKVFDMDWRSSARNRANPKARIVK